MEQWKVVPNSNYIISSEGRLYNSYMKSYCRSNYELPYGYCLKTIKYKNNTQKNWLIHRLVWTIFKGEIPEGMEIDHIDDNPRNNKLDNLRLVTREENVKKMKPKQSKIYNSFKVAQYDLNDNLINIYNSIRQAAKMNNCRVNHITDCCKGHMPTYKGYKWKYVEED